MEKEDYPALKDICGLRFPYTLVSSFDLELPLSHPRIVNENSHSLDKKLYDSY